MIVTEIQDTNFIMVVTYIPPNNTKYYSDIYFDNLRLVIDTFQTSKNILIVGDLNSRIKNNFPNNGFQYQVNPDQAFNQNGRHLIKILNGYKKILVVNGIIVKNRRMDSKFSFYRGTSSSQIDLALCNNVDIIQSFIIHNKLPQSDHCPCSIKALLTYQPSLEIISECSSGFKSYHHFDISKRIKRRININRIDLNILSDNLSRLGDDIHSQYINTIPSQMSIDNFSDDLTNGIYECFMKSKMCNVTVTRQPTQRNCTSHNSKAIADAHINVSLI